MKVRPIAGLALTAGIAVACADSTGPAPGNLTLTATGIPGGGEAMVIVRGPDRFLDSAMTGTVLSDLAAGTYELTARVTAIGEDRYAASEANVTVDVGGADGSAEAVFAFALASGRVAFTFTGVPNGSEVPAVVTGPNRYVRAISSDVTVTGIPAGEYVLTTLPIDSSGHTFASTPLTRPLTVAPSTTPISLPVTYTLASARTAVEITGLPPGAAASVTITGPNGYQALLTTSDTLIQLVPGTYQVEPADVVAGGQTFAAASSSLTLGPGRTAVPTTVDYRQTTGTLIVTINGLPPNNPAAVSVEGPDTSFTLMYTDTLVGLVAADYTVRAPALVTGGVEYVAVDSVQTRTLAAATTEQIDVAYQFSGNATLNLTVVQAYIVQSIQRSDGTVPLVAGRDGFLRVFAVASEANTMQPAVVARFYRNGAPIDSVTIPAPQLSVPTKVTEGPKDYSWNATLPGSLLTGGNLAMQIEVDPDHLVPEADDDDNLFPANGSLLPVDTRSLAPFPLRLVPVINGTNQGNVSAGNRDAFLWMFRGMYPIGADTVDVRVPFTSSVTALRADDQDTWSNTLMEIQALRTVDQYPGYYYGVVRVDYTNGIAGLGYIPSSANTDFVVSVGWDDFPSAPRILAHEVGHNFGRRHAPCGNPASPDPAYPYPNGDIGHYGFEAGNGEIKIPQLPDIMSYCLNPWVSDYTFEGILARREASVNGSPWPASAQAVRSLLVWGRLRSDSLVLEPAFEIEGRPSVPPSPGPYRVEGLGPDGTSVFDLSFAGVEVADLPAPERHFAFLVPLTGLAPVRTVRLTGAGLQTVRTATRPLSAPPFVPVADVVAIDARHIRVTWDPVQHPMIMVRDPRTKQVLAFARGGSALVATDVVDVELLYSDGTGGPTITRPVRGRQ